MQNRLVKIVENIKQPNIMIVGDMIADVYLEGKISRISREAPVLILEHQAENVVPGGAANAVHNAAMLGGKVYAVGVVGDDYAGRQLAGILSSKAVETSGFIVDAARPTITKTRVMAGGEATVRQQVVRIDKELREALSIQAEQQLHRYIMEHIGSMAAVVLSDYGSQTISPAIRNAVIDYCHGHSIPCMVDSRYNVLAYEGITVVKQNESEAAAAVGRKLTDESVLVEAGKMILDRVAAEAVLISRGPDGMTLFERNGKYAHIPVTNKSEVYDVTGAGDTVVAAMALAIAAGASYLDAARIANYAAGIVVRKPGTATTSQQEVCQAIGDHHENS